MERRKLTINMHELMANLYIAMLSALSGIRGLEWGLKDVKELENVSRLYIKLNNIVDIQALGLILFIASIMVFCAVFLKGRTAFLFIVIGGAICSAIHFVYAMVSVEAAGLFATYYSGLIIACGHLILVLIGAINLWKKNNSVQ